jgi:hypothetical protein
MLLHGLQAGVRAVLQGRLLHDLQTVLPNVLQGVLPDLLQGLRADLLQSLHQDDLHAGDDLQDGQPQGQGVLHRDVLRAGQVQALLAAHLRYLLRRSLHLLLQASERPLAARVD